MLTKTTRNSGGCLKVLLMIAFMVPGIGIDATRVANATYFYSAKDSQLTSSQYRLDTVVQMKFHQDIVTVGEAVSFALQRSEFSLPAYDATNPVAVLLAQPLKEHHREIGPLPLDKALQKLAGEDYRLVINPQAHMVTFQQHKKPVFDQPAPGPALAYNVKPLSDVVPTAKPQVMTDVPVAPVVVKQAPSVVVSERTESTQVTLTEAIKTSVKTIELASAEPLDVYDEEELIEDEAELAAEAAEEEIEEAFSAQEESKDVYAYDEQDVEVDTSPVVEEETPEVMEEEPIVTVDETSEQLDDKLMGLASDGYSGHVDGQGSLVKQHIELDQDTVLNSLVQGSFKEAPLLDILNSLIPEGWRVTIDTNRGDILEGHWNFYTTTYRRQALTDLLAPLGMEYRMFFELRDEHGFPAPEVLVTDRVIVGGAY